MDAYYSQAGEVEWIVKNVPLPKQGFFVDVGAYDGITDSNTYWFERRGWKGICIEPDPRMLPLLKKNRTCEILTCAVGEGEMAKFFLSDTIPAWSGTTPPIGEAKEITVPMRRLDDFVVFCDVLSIDTEGTETEVMRTIDLHTWDIKVILLEWDSQSRPNGDHEQEIRDYMANQPYDLGAKIGANLIYVRRPNV